uniref:Uncharacterized protein n=1 Tax=viral metagenome TaxID=1070528 RepID=A0A6C0F876_9ZZZZ|tara:strand:+ start:11051 stop:11638 length:588 start_codon:yes stop_codon:yes gene_type:complete
MSTSISSLPNELSIEKNKEPVTLNVKEKNFNETQQNPAPENTQTAELSKDSINKIIEGLQHASSSGSTSLNSRDIPMSMEQITHDYTARPNFVPAPEKMNYIQDEETMETLIKQKREEKKNQMEFFYDEIQTPLLVMVMFFVFQLPIFKKSMVNNFQAFFQRNGNYNLKGMVFTTVLFGGFYYSIIKTIKYLSEL